MQGLPTSLSVLWQQALVIQLISLPWKLTTIGMATTSTGTTEMTVTISTGTVGTTGKTESPTSPLESENVSPSSSFDPIPLFIGVISVLLVVIGVTGGLAFWWRRTRKHASENIELTVTSGFMTDIKIQHQIGGGNFGAVYRGLWQDTTVVALKKLKGIEQLKEFETEVNTLRYVQLQFHSFPSYHLLFRSLDHPNIVHYFGIYSAPNGVHYIVTEFLSKGSLLHFLHSEKDNLTTVDLLNISKQTAAGMNYLESKNIIHRDLAARNILVKFIKAYGKIQQWWHSRSSKESSN